MANETKSIFKNGATWLRGDFHLHTKADKEFLYTGDENAFCQLYVEKLKEQNIGIGVIANHNKFDRKEFAALRKKALKEGIGLFAGVELSVNDGANGIHCVLVFDFKKWCINDENLIDRFLDVAFDEIPNRENENTPCQYSFKDLLDKLNKHSNDGRDSFIILAHVERNSGFFKELKGGRIQRLGSTDLFRRFVLGFQQVRTHDEVTKWKGWLDNQLPAFVEGSDCKSIDDVGTPRQQNDKDKKTYVKIGDFNFEALKYALIDSKHRISEDTKPKIKNSYIKSIAFEGGLLEGAKLDFSPELNNVIGIRGSGKSSLLEVLRYALGVSLPTNAADPDYKNSLPARSVGSGGKTIVTIVNKQDVEYKIEKLYDQKEVIYEYDQPRPDLSMDSIDFPLPIYFGQKDLANKGADFEGDLIQRLIGTRLEPVQVQIKKKKEEVADIIAEGQKLQNLNVEKKETEDSITNARYRLEYFKDKGIEGKLKQQTLLNSDIATLVQTESTIKGYLSELDSVISDHDDIFQQKITGSADNKELFEEAKAIIQELRIGFEKLKTIRQSSFLSQQKLQGVIAKINDKKEGLKEEFAKIKREINTDTINPDDFLDLNKRIEIAKLKLGEIKKSEERRERLRAELSNQLAELEVLWGKEHQLLNAEVAKINEANEKLSIEVEYKGRKDKFLDKIKQVFTGSGIRAVDYDRIKSAYEDFIEIRRDILTKRDKSKLNDILNAEHVIGFKKRFKENLTDLLTFKVENKITIQYNGKSLDKHSLGQSASALMLFLLAQKDNDVLIIDQPEDDLDNQTIYDDLIKKLRQIKGDMQFIFATHNANITVLGDSEQVFSCSYDEKQITVRSGAIDNHETQRSIVDVMEGGDEAFSRRKNIYNIWNIEKSNSK